MNKSPNVYLQYFVNMKPAVFFVASVLLLFLALVPLTRTEAGAVNGDCDSNAIIRCGVGSSGELANDYASLDALGKSAFRDAGVDPSKFGQLVRGSVTRDNRVVVNGRTVATNVYTYGRQYMPGSVQVPGGAWKRHPSVSFRSNSIPAYIYMQGNHFKWAVIDSCGNPVKGNPTEPEPKPAQRIEKKVSTANTSVSTDAAYFYGKEIVKVAPGTNVRFITQADNIGNVSLTGSVLDKIPAGTSFVSGKYQLKEGGKIVKTGQVGKAQNGQYGWIGTLKPGAEVKIDITVKYNTNKKVENIACIDTGQLPKECDNAFIESEPAAACVSLKAEKVNFNTVRFVGKASTRDGAKVKAYYFKPSLNPNIPSQIVTTSSNEATKQYTYANPGNYTAQLTLDTTVGNRSGEQCKVQIRIASPDVVCEDLQIDSIDRLTRRLTASAVSTNGAKIEGYAFDFGDGETEETEAPVVTHEYKPGSYTAKVTVKTSLGDKTSEACQVRIQIADQDEPALDIEKKVTDDLSLQPNEEGFDKAKELVEVKPNTNVKFIIKFTNIGNIALEDVVVKDVLPEGLSLQEGQLELTIDKIEPGESTYFEVLATANESIGNATVTNVVCAVHDTNGDGKIDIDDCAKDNCPKNPDIKEGEDLEDCDDAKVRIVTPTTPTVLPRTGIASVVGGFGSLAMIIAAGHSWIVSRRKLVLAHLRDDK